MKRQLTYDFVYQQPIDAPVPAQEMHKQACSGDTVTIKSWYDTWLSNYKAAVARFGDLGAKSFGKLYGINKFKPAIVLGSGPSLKNSIEALRMNKAMKTPVLTVSTLHNFGYLDDEGVHADYYVSLDAGKIVIADVAEGRKQTPEYYWEQTKGKTLIAVAFSDPELFDKWQGDIYLFNASIPDEKFHKECQGVQEFTHVISSGGNAGSAAVYVAKAVMGSYTIMMCGLDFCFDYDDKFHSYDTHYDTPGQYVMHPDCYGIPRKTWQSYMNFAMYMNWLVQKIPGDWINCSEGVMGSFREGNLRAFTFLPLEQALNRFFMAERVWLDRIDNETGQIVERKEIKLEEVFSDPKYPVTLTVY